MMTTSITRAKTKKQLDHYHVIRNTQQPPNQIRVQIPIDSCSVDQVVEVTVKGHRLNGKIDEVDIWKKPQRNPATNEIGLGRIKIVYTDTKQESKWFDCVSYKDAESSHFVCFYHWHFIPNSAADIDLKRKRNTRVVTPLTFNPHTSSVLVDQSTNRQWDSLLTESISLANNMMLHQDTFGISDMKRIFDVYVTISTQKTQQIVNNGQIIEAMSVINAIKSDVHVKENEKMKGSHQLLGAVTVVKSDNKNVEDINANDKKTIKPKIKPKNKPKVVLECPFKCGSTFTGSNAKASMYKHIVSHTDDDNYEETLPHVCGIDGCTSRFSTQIDLKRHKKYSPFHVKRYPFTIPQSCPKCIFKTGTASAGQLQKSGTPGNWKMVWCSKKKKKCGYSQAYKGDSHVYTYGK
eukprot:170598_1